MERRRFVAGGAALAAATPLGLVSRRQEAAFGYHYEQVAAPVADTLRGFSLTAGDMGFTSASGAAAEMADALEESALWLLADQPGPAFGALDRLEDLQRANAGALEGAAGESGIRGLVTMIFEAPDVFRRAAERVRDLLDEYAFPVDRPFRDDVRLCLRDFGVCALDQGADIPVFSLALRCAPTAAAAVVTAGSSVTWFGTCVLRHAAMRAILPCTDPMIECVENAIVAARERG